MIFPCFFWPYLTILRGTLKLTAEIAEAAESNYYKLFDKAGIKEVAMSSDTKQKTLPEKKSSNSSSMEQKESQASEADSLREEARRALEKMDRLRQQKSKQRDQLLLPEKKPKPVPK